MSADLWAAIHELERRVEALQRLGIVASVIGDSVTISYPDLPDSEPMPYLASSSGFTVDPTIGDQALVVMPSGDPLKAIALCGVSSTDMDKGGKTGAARADLGLQAGSGTDFFGSPGASGIAASRSGASAGVQPGSGSDRR